MNNEICKNRGFTKLVDGIKLFWNQVVFDVICYSNICNFTIPETL